MRWSSRKKGNRTILSCVAHWTFSFWESTNLFNQSKTWFNHPLPILPKGILPVWFYVAIISALNSIACSQSWLLRNSTTALLDLVDVMLHAQKSEMRGQIKLFEFGNELSDSHVDCFHEKTWSIQFKLSWWGTNVSIRQKNLIARAFLTGREYRRNEIYIDPLIQRNLWWYFEDFALVFIALRLADMVTSQKWTRSHQNARMAKCHRRRPTHALPPCGIAS